MVSKYLMLHRDLVYWTWVRTCRPGPLLRRGPSRMSPSTLKRPEALSSMLSRFVLYDEDGVAAWEPGDACHTSGTEGLKGVGL